MAVSEITEKIEQLVFDENKVVTYKLLSTELSVHVNKAKQLLNDYITDHYGKKNALNVLYAVSGFQKYCGHQIHKLTVVSKDDLEKIKKDFSLLSSVHIYSIQKSSSLDECSLYASDYLITKSSDSPCRFSAIKHPDLKIKENRVLKNAESSVNKEKNKNHESQTTKRNEQKSSVPAKKTNALLLSWQKKDTVKSEQKDEVAKEQNEDLLSAASQNEKAVDEKKFNGSPQKVSKASDKGKKNNIMSMFSKQAAKAVSKPVNQNSEKSVVSNHMVCEKEEKDVKKTEVKSKQVRTTNSKKVPMQKERQKSKRTHDISDDDSDNEWKKPKKKKHKRIITAFSDSESESEGEEEKDRLQRSFLNSNSPEKARNNGFEEETIPTRIEEEPIPTRIEEEPIPAKIEEDDEEPIPPTPQLLPANKGKRKKLKFVNRTFEDDDGFLVTRKVKEYVTDSEGSDNESAVQAKTAPKVVPKPDIKQSFVNKKQASLMSFFKQK